MQNIVCFHRDSQPLQLVGQRKVQVPLAFIVALNACRRVFNANGISPFALVEQEFCLRRVFAGDALLTVVFDIASHPRVSVSEFGVEGSLEA